MLVLSRRLNEKIVLPTIDATIQVVGFKPGVVRLGIQAPAQVTVLREEIWDRMGQWQPPTPEPSHPSPGKTPDHIAKLLENRLRIAAAGLSQLREQLRAGLSGDAEVTLHKLWEDLHLLRQRLKAEAGNGSVQPPPPPVRRPRKALLVEDNPNERELLATFLRTVGVDVDTANDGTDALNYLHSRARPDIVLLDMGLPRCDGATMVREIRRDPVYSGLKIFAVTGHMPEEFDLGPGGVDRWFQKPINAPELARHLNEELDRTLKLAGTGPRA